MIFLAGGENVLKIVEPLPPQVVALHTAVDEIFKYFPSIFFLRRPKVFVLFFSYLFLAQLFPALLLVFIEYLYAMETKRKV